MKIFCIFILFASLTGWTDRAEATPPVGAVYILCVKSGGANCSTDGFDTKPYNAYQFVYAQGFNEPGDGGGGTFAYMVGVSGLTCTSRSNGGTILQDNSSPKQCFQRLDPNWGPKEYGAKGLSGGGTDDSVALQNWLDATQPHIGDVDTYPVQSFLDCKTNTTIQGPANFNGNAGTPLFTIRAVGGSGWGTYGAVVQGEDHCRISGVGIDGNGVAIPVAVLKTHVTIDGFSALINGSPNNLTCGGSLELQSSGLEVKDTQVKAATSDNIYMPSNCANVRLVGDIITGAGGNGVWFGGDDLTVADGIIEESQGVGLMLAATTHMAQVTGMSFQQNGNASPYGPAIQIGDATGGASWISICGNHFYENGYDNIHSSHVLFVHGSNINLCGNAYRANATNGPAYVYDAASGASLQNLGLYESWQPQDVGVFTPNAAAVLPQAQVLPAPRSFLTGLALSNNSGSATTVDIAFGQATDSTGVAVIQNSSSCSVNLLNTGLMGLDTVSSLAANTTYFFFVVADLSPPAASPGTSPSCIASKNLTPNIATTTYGHPIWRLVGALYTDNTSPTPKVVPFSQDGDIFYLATSVLDITTGSSPLCSVGTSSGTLCQLSVPCGRTAATCTSLPPVFTVEAFGRIVGGSPANKLLYISSPLQGDLAPTNFPAAPGFTSANTISTIPATFPSAYPFHLTTDGSGSLRVRSSGTSTTAYEITDGWLWHRQQ